MNKLLLVSFLLSSQIYGADLSLDPTYLKLKVYKVAVSTSVLCTDLITVLDESSPNYQDVLTSPTFGSGTLANGTYPCVVIEFSDRIKYSPSTSSTSGNCVQNTEYTLDVCSSGSSKNIAGDTVTCDATENQVAMYLSTTSTNTTGSDAFNPPTQLSDATYGFNLANALTVSASTVGTFVVNGTDKICDTNDSSCSGSASTCEMQPPIFSFR
jgi:hypothetical protein